MSNRIFKQSVFLFLIAVMFVTFFGCGKNENVEDELERIDVVEDNISDNEDENIEVENQEKERETCGEYKVRTFTVSTGGVTEEERKKQEEGSKKLDQYAKDGNIKEWEDLTGEKFTLSDFDYLDVKVKGYIVKEKMDLWGEELIKIYFIVTETDNNDFKYTLENSNDYCRFDDDLKNDKTCMYKITVGCLEDSEIKGDLKADAGKDYINKNLQKLLLNSSKSNPVEVIFNFRESSGFGCRCCNEAYQIKEVN